MFKVKQNLISHLFIVATLLISGIFLNLVQLLLRITLKPLNRKLFQHVMYYVSWTWLAQAVFIIDYWSGSKIILYCKPEDLKYFGKEHNLTLLNHTYEIDWLVSWLVLEKFKSLGCGRGFAKSAIKYIPIIGWLFLLDDHIFLERSFEKDQKVIEHKIANYSEYPNNTWMFITPEGTRFTKEKHETSEKFAREKNIEPLKHHLIPRPGGFNVCIPLLKKYKCPALYNFQLAFDKNEEVAPKLGNLLMGKPVTAHVFIERIPMENVEPTFEFLHDVYKKKDALQDSFHKFGNFYEGRGEKVIPGTLLKNRSEVLLNTIVWVAITTLIIAYYSMKLILAGKIFILISIIVVVTTLIYLMLQNILRHSNVNKGSQYGR